MELTTGQNEERIIRLVAEIKAEKNHSELMALTGELNDILNAKASTQTG